MLLCIEKFWMKNNRKKSANFFGWKIGDSSGFLKLFLPLFLAG
jgi:hypothetical protein